MGAKAKIKLVAILGCFVIVVGVVSMIFCISAVKFAYPVKYDDLVEQYSEEYGIPHNLLMAVIRTESSFNPDAVSSAGAVGLTQITPETFEWLQTKTGESFDVTELQNEEISIKYGALFLGLLLDEFEDVKTAVAAYHAGRGRVNEWLKDESISPDGKTLSDIPIPETAHYVRKVMRAVNIYEKINSKP